MTSRLPVGWLIVAGWVVVFLVFLARYRDLVVQLLQGAVAFVGILLASFVVWIVVFVATAALITLLRGWQSRSDRRR